jgi:hypothetical protein
LVGHSRRACTLASCAAGTRPLLSGSQRRFAALEAIHRDGEQLQVVPGGDLLEAIRKFRIEPGDGSAKCVEAPAAELLEAAFRDDIGALPIIAAVERDEYHAGLDAAEQLRGVARVLGEAEPDYVHRRAEILDLQPGAHPHIGVASIGADNQIGPDLERAVRRFGL